MGSSQRRIIKEVATGWFYTIVSQKQETQIYLFTSFQTISRNQDKEINIIKILLSHIAQIRNHTVNPDIFVRILFS